MKSFKSKFDSLVTDVQNRVAKNPKMESAVIGASNTASSMFQGAMSFAKGVAQGHGSLKATFVNINNVSIPRSGHSLSIVKGRAYIFGGEIEKGELADNDIYMVILPSGGVQDADFTNIEARAKTLREGAPLDAPTGAVPESRKGHSTVVVGDNIYMFGGENEDGRPVDAQTPGRVWVFDTTIKAWSALDPATELAPRSRSLHGAVASEEPGPITKQTVHDPLPQQPLDPAKTVPDVPDKDTWGTVIVSGGRDTLDSSLLLDTWAFDIRTRTWTSLPPPPPPARTGASLALAGHTLYRFGGHSGSQHLGGGIDTFDLTGVLSKPSSATATTPLSSRTWVSQPYINGEGPRERTLAGLTTISVGQGRHHLLLLGGQTSTSPSSPPAYFDDVWTYQLVSGSLGTVAGLKDATTARLHLPTGTRRESSASQGSPQRPSSQHAPQNQNAWAEVRYQYVDADGDVKPAGRSLDESLGKGIGSRGGFAVARGTEVDGASVVVWGGVGKDGKMLGDGWLITVER